MSGTTNLGVGYITASQNQKEVTANAAFDRLDKALTETFDADVTSGNVTLTSTQYREALHVRATNATTAGRTVTLPAIERLVILSNPASNTQAVDFVRGSATVTLAAGEAAVARTDGTANGLQALMTGAAGGVSLAFTDLNDAPASYTGQAGKRVVVNGTEDGLEFAAAVGGAEAFTELSDAPASYTGQGGKFVRVNSGATALEFTALPACLVIAVSDETTALTTGAAKVTFRMPFAMTLTAVRASVNTVSSSGAITIDVNEGGSSIFSTLLTIDASEKSSTTAATAAVISDSALADDAEMTIDIDGAGTGAKGLKVVLLGTYA